MTERYHAGSVLPEIGTSLLLPVEESHHLYKVMRLRLGDRVRVFSHGKEATGTFAGMEGKQARIKLIEAVIPPSPAQVAVHCIVPWIKGGRTELVLQKSTELGVARFTVFHARREVMRGGAEKLDRLRRVILDACKQCGRADVPEVTEAESLSAAIKEVMLPAGQCLLLVERGQSISFSAAVRAMGQVSDVAIASGPEGGFDPAELDSVQTIATRTSLGPRILRAETASIVAVSGLLALSGEW